MKFVAPFMLSLAAFNLTAAESPKNIIMVVGDGMGPAYTTAYRLFSDDKSTPEVERTVFDRHLVGMASTHPAQVSGYVTDSAAGATALSSGIKSYNGAIAVDVDKKPVRTVLQLAKQKGMKTGVAVTSQINHATPASFTAHNESRDNYNDIADSYYDHKLSGKFVLDVMLGGGWDFFKREDRDLTELFQQAGYQYVDKYKQLESLKPGKPVLGLFGDRGLPWALDDSNPIRLKKLTQSAVKQLENDKGFFLLVEGSQVDWAGHGNDVASAMAEMHDLAETLSFLEKYVTEHQDTLVVITADHSTGGLTLAANGDYHWTPDLLKGLKASPQTIAEKLIEKSISIKQVEELLGFSLEEDEVESLLEDAEDLWEKASYVTEIIDARTNTGWTTSGHTAVDVPVYAMGVGKEQFAGFVDNTEIPKKIFSILEAKN